MIQYINYINQTSLQNLLIYIIILTIVIFFILASYQNKFIKRKESYSDIHNNINKDDKIIWTYWENQNGKIPSHIELCLETFKKHLNSKYKLIILNEKTIKNYLPNVRNDFDNLMIAQKVDYYRIALLYEYGGIWIDADTIIMSDLDDIFEKLITYDFVGFGCTDYKCFNGKDQPSNGVLASKKNSKLMKLCLDKLNQKLNTKTNLKQINYYDLGKYIIWESLKELKKTGYDYYHYPSEYDGTRDSNGIWIDTNRHFSKVDIKLINENKLFFIFLTNAGINKYQPWVKNANRNDILYNDYWISKMFRKSLNIV